MLPISVCLALGIALLAHFDPTAVAQATLLALLLRRQE